MEVSQPTSVEQRVDTLQPTTSTSLSAASDSLPVLPILESSTTSPHPSNCVPVSSTYSSDPELNGALHVLFHDDRCTREDRVVSDDMVPYLPPFLFPLPPLPQSTDLLPHGVSQCASKEQGVDTLQPPTSTAKSHLPSLDSLHVLPMSIPSSPLPSTSTPSPSAYSSPEVCTINNENSNQEKMASEVEYTFELFSLIPLPQSTDLPSQGVSQPTSVEQRVDTLQPTTSTSLSAASDSLPVLPILESSTTSPHPSNCVPVSSTYSSDPELNGALHVLFHDDRCTREDRVVSDDMVPYLPPFLFPLPPLPQSTDLLPHGVSQCASKEQGVDTLQPPTSTAKSHLPSLDSLHVLPMSIPSSPLPSTSTPSPSAYSSPEVCTINNENSNQEKMASEVEYTFELFSLIPLPQSTDLPSQGVSQPTSMKQRADMLQPPT